MSNSIVHRIKNTVILEKIFNEIGFANIRIVNHHNFIKYAIKAPHIDKVKDKFYIEQAFNKIYEKIKDNINALNLLLAANDNNNKIFYQYKNIAIQCFAKQKFIDQEYYLLSHSYQLNIPKQFTNNPIQYYFDHPVIWIINCYKQDIFNKENFNYTNTKTILLADPKLVTYDSMMQNFNLNEFIDIAE